MRERASHLIVGLGNPGKKYENTRHNIGFKIVDAFVEAKKVFFRKKKECKGEIAKGIEPEGNYWVLKPHTYMNLSGEAVKACKDSYEIPEESILVVSDDLDLPFGELRMKPQGSSGGHNGLKSIEYYLQTREYPRLRFGIGRPEGRDSEEFVLEEFSGEEKKLLPGLIQDAAQAVDLWLRLGIQKAMMSVNGKKH